MPFTAEDLAKSHSLTIPERHLESSILTLEAAPSQLIQAPTSLFPPTPQPEKQCSLGLGKMRSVTVSFTCPALRSPSKPQRLVLLQLSPFLPVPISSSSTLTMDAHLWKIKPSTTQIQAQMQMSPAKLQTRVPLPELVGLSMALPHLAPMHRDLLREVQAVKAPVLQ